MVKDQGPSSHVWGLLGPSRHFPGPKVEAAWCLLLQLLWVHVCLELLSMSVSGFLTPVPGDMVDRIDTKDAHICLDIPESPAVD